MTLTNEQIKLISSSILVSDVIAYIDEHQKEYEEFMKNEELYKNKIKGGNKDDKNN